MKVSNLIQFKSISPSKDFYRNVLNEQSKKVYDLILDAALNLKNEVKIPLDSSISIPDVLDCIHYDHPELYYFNVYECDLENPPLALGKYGIFKPAYNLVGDKMVVEGRVNKMVKDIADNNKTQMSRLVAIANLFYEFEYDYEHMNRLSIRDHSIYDPVMVKNGVCEGFSLLFKLLCSRLGIECICVEGLSAGGLHLWNAVEIDGDIYHVDMTNSISVYSYQRKIKFSNFILPLAFLEDTEPYINLKADQIRNNPFVKLGHYFKDEIDLMNKLKEYAQKGKSFTLLYIGNNDHYVNPNVSSNVPGIDGYFVVERYYRFFVRERVEEYRLE